MSEIPTDRLYSPEHVWVLFGGTGARVGITEFAQRALGELVFVRLRPVDSAVGTAASLGEVESLKSTSEVYAPIGGRVARLNSVLESRPELVNSDPYGEGWLCELDVADDPGAVAGLLGAEEYRSRIEEGT
jgi:glycine cleavage system H protein